MHFTYILYSAKLDKFYIGSTSCKLQVRIDRHNLGLSKFTARGIPWELKYFESFTSLPLAKNRELQLKAAKSRKVIEKLISQKS